jgi:AhpD family alkylhydroperoxidase
MPSLESAVAAFGFIPNLIGVMASSPALAEAYLSLSDIFENKTALDSIEKQVVLLTVSRYHECRYCVAAHSMAAELKKVPSDIIHAIRNDHPIANPKLESLRSFITNLLEQRGWLSEKQMEAFYAAGYTPAHLFDLLVGVAQKTLSNFTNHIASTPLDEVMSGNRWSPGNAEL